MTKDNSAAVSEALSNLLDLERQALLAGDLKTIGILLEEKSVLVGQLANQHVDSGDGLQPVQAKLKRNQERAQAKLEAADESIRRHVEEQAVDHVYSLLKAAKAAWLDKGTGRPHRFHHVSTDEVYGTLELDDPAFSETTPYAPNSPYSASKAGSDHLVRAYHHTYGLETTTSNCSNNYGPFQFPEKLIPLFTLNALSGKPLPIYGDGMNVRDWLHVEDHCRGIEACLQKGKPGEVYNIGGGQELPNLTVIEEICRSVDDAFTADPALAERFPAAPAAQGRPSAELKTYVTDRKGHDRRYAIDETKARQELGYVPARDFSQGFAETLAWFLSREDWWAPLLQRAALAH